MQKINKPTILIAPLDWGLGHVTRCIPIIRTLKNLNYDVIVAVCEKQKKVLTQEFTELKFIELSGYGINYAKNKHLFALKIFFQIPKILHCINKEHNWLKDIVVTHNIALVISDNRYGLYHNIIPSIFITHQLTIKAPIIWIENLLQKINYRFINKFTQCWIPDIKGENNIAGLLSRPSLKPQIPIHYIGVLSRFAKPLPTGNIYDVCILLSGPEPQRTVLENILFKQLKNQTALKILFIRGLPLANKNIEVNGLEIKNHLLGKYLQIAICNSNIIVARSGYTTVMELLSLQKKSILIPTPAQTEQEYLATYLYKQSKCLSFTQSKINIIEAVKMANKFEFNLPNNLTFKDDIIIELVCKLIG